jgi:hypothetical protein
MIELKSNIFKKITLGLTTIICTCALYSYANAGEEIIYNDGFFTISQEEASINAESVNSNVDKIPDENVDVLNVETKEHVFKVSFDMESVASKVLFVAFPVAVLLTAFGTREAYSRFKQKQEACKTPNWERK